MGNLSAHFSQSEFLCNHCTAQKGPPRTLVAVLEKLRALDGRPLIIVSGFRCEAHNRSVGGARTSQHLLGRAADIPHGRFTVDQARAAGAVGIGYRAGWVTHVDVRTTSPATWSYD